MNQMILATLIALLVGGWPSPAQIAPSLADQQMPKREAAYDGKWWSAANSEEKAGFLNGTADCLISNAHEKWITRSVAWAVPKITEYYKAHPTCETTPVPEVWHKVISATPRDGPSKDGEVFTNPHGYYDGQYWREGDDSEHEGFLEGYLFCLRTAAKSPTEIYSQPLSYYVEKINAYLKAHPDGDHEAIAAILSRFRDKPKPKKPTTSPGASAWWLSADPGERAGFVNGLADCMTWEAHKKGYNATSAQLNDKITKFYQTNPASKDLSVLTASGGQISFYHRDTGQIETYSP